MHWLRSEIVPTVTLFSGTVEEVLRGYIGDQGAKPVFESDGPMAPLGQAFDILGKVGAFDANVFELNLD